MENLEMNTVLKNRYQVKSVLGRNALGITYEAVDTGSGRTVVVRELFPEGLCSRVHGSMNVSGNEQFPARKEQFIRQMQCLVQNKGLKGIVEGYDVFEEHGTAYCVTEYVEGVSLEKYLSKSGKQFPVKRIKELTMPVVESLVSLHQAGVIHQNISPDNLVFTNKGDLKLIGFGCMEGHVSSAGTGYAPVEMYRRQHECSPATDVYSLCASVYRCITGVVPQDARTRLNDDQLKKPSQLGTEIDPGDEAALMMGLQIYVEKRFRAMLAFQNAFYVRSVSTAKPVQPTPPPAVKLAQPTPPSQQGAVIVQTNSNDTLEQPRKKKRGNGGMIAVAVIGGILIIGLGISAFILGKDMLPGVDKGLKAVAETESDEETGEDESGNDSDDVPYIGAEYEDMMAAGNYSGVLEAIIAMDTADMDAAQKDILSGILSQAVTGQYTEFENRVNECMNTGAFDSAFAAVGEELALYDRLAAHSMAVQYINRQQVEDKRAIVKQAHVAYLLNTKLKDAVGMENDTELDSVLNSLQEYVNEGMLSQEELDTKKAGVYAAFVLDKITVMNNAGTDASEIVMYIDGKLSDTGYNSSVLEYWDYFKAVMGQAAGDPATVRSASSSGYLLPDSSTRNLTTGDISMLSGDALRLATYEIFARHGKIFQDQAVSQYFSAFSWYQPSGNYDESTLNPYEKFNLGLLVEYQKANGYR